MAYLLSLFALVAGLLGNPSHIARAVPRAQFTNFQDSDGLTTRERQTRFEAKIARRLTIQIVLGVIAFIGVIIWCVYAWRNRMHI